MIVFGTRVRSSTIRIGAFWCPACEGPRAFVHRRHRRWFTVSFVPLLPLHDSGETVECQICRSRYPPAVLAA